MTVPRKIATSAPSETASSPEVPASTSRLAQLAVKSGVAIALSVGSQVLGLAQLLLLLSDGAGRPTDAYFYMLSWSTVPVQVLLVGTYYPLLLRGKGPSRLRERVLMWAAIGSGVLLVAVAFTLYRLLTGAMDGLVAIAIALAAMAVASVPAWHSALRDSASGNPKWLSGVTLLPSVGAILALLAAHQLSLSGRVAAMLIGQAAGFAIYRVARHVYAPPVHEHPPALASKTDNADSANSASSWLLAQAVVAYGSSIWIQTVATALPDAGLTTLGVTAKIVAAGSTLVSNAVLPVVLHRSSSSKRGVIYFSWCVLVLGGLTSVAIAFVPVKREYEVIALLSTLWLAAIVFNAAMHRLAYRFHSPRFALITIVVSVIVPIVLLASTQWHDLSISQVVVAFIALDLLSGVVFALLMRLPLLAGAYLALSAVTALLLTQA